MWNNLKHFRHIKTIYYVFMQCSNISNCMKYVVCMYEMFIIFHTSSECMSLLTESYAAKYFILRQVSSCCSPAGTAIFLIPSKSNTVYSLTGTATYVILRQRNTCCSPAGTATFLIPWKSNTVAALNRVT